MGVLQPLVVKLNQIVSQLYPQLSFAASRLKVSVDLEGPFGEVTSNLAFAIAEALRVRPEVVAESVCRELLGGSGTDALLAIGGLTFRVSSERGFINFGVSSYSPGHVQCREDYSALGPLRICVIVGRERQRWISSLRLAAWVALYMQSARAPEGGMAVNFASDSSSLVSLVSQTDQIVSTPDVLLDYLEQSSGPDFQAEEFLDLELERIRGGSVLLLVSPGSIREELVREWCGKARARGASIELFAPTRDWIGSKGDVDDVERQFKARLTRLALGGSGDEHEITSNLLVYLSAGEVAERLDSRVPDLLDRANQRAWHKRIISRLTGLQLPNFEAINYPQSLEGILQCGGVPAYLQRTIRSAWLAPILFANIEQQSILAGQLSGALRQLGVVTGLVDRLLNDPSLRIWIEKCAPQAPLPGLLAAMLELAARRPYVRGVMRI